jgi:opacity protein-like surface antigen
MRKVLLLTVLAFFAATTGILAQLTAGASLVFVKPLGGFAQNVNNTAGIGLNLGYRINNLPIEAGLSFSFVSYANVTERVPYSEPNYQHTEADRERCSGVNMYNIFTRAYAFKNKAIQPYADVRFGFSRFVTSEEYTDPFRQDNSSCHSAPVLKRVNFIKDHAFNYGAGAGMHIDLYKLFAKKDNDCSLLLDGSLNYMRGGYATYRNIIKDTNPRDDRGNCTTRTDMWLINIGIKFGFGLYK